MSKYGFGASTVLGTSPFQDDPTLGPYKTKSITVDDALYNQEVSANSLYGMQDNGKYGPFCVSGTISAVTGGEYTIGTTDAANFSAGDSIVYWDTSASDMATPTAACISSVSTTTGVVIVTSAFNPAAVVTDLLVQDDGTNDSINAVVVTQKLNFTSTGTDELGGDVHVTAIYDGRLDKNKLFRTTCFQADENQPLRLETKLTNIS